MDWQPIDSMAKMGQKILIYRRGSYHKNRARGERVHYAVVHWDGRQWKGNGLIMRDDDVTHWQSLPPPPAQQ